MSSEPGGGVDLTAVVAGLLDDISRPGRAVEEVMALGRGAIEPLDRYLEGPPRAVPHARQLAARLLGLLGGVAAHEVLRKALRRYDLAALDPVIAMSEYVVKSEIVEQLLLAGRFDLADDYLRAFRVDRLAIAATALARAAATAAIPDLVAALEDDLLVERAAEALRQLGTAAGPALAATLAVRGCEPDSGQEVRRSRGRRIAAAMVLGDLEGPIGSEELRSQLGDESPAVAAAAAVAQYARDPSRLSAEQLRALVRGAVAPEWRVRERCQEAVRVIGAPCVGAAVEVLAACSTVDLYGVPVRVGPAEARWLVELILINAPDDAAWPYAALDDCDPAMLADALRAVHEGRAAANVARLCHHREPLVRAAAARALGRLGGPDGASVVVELLRDASRQVRASAARALLERAATDPDQVIEALARTRARRRWWWRMRVWWTLFRLRRREQRSEPLPRH